MSVIWNAFSREGGLSAVAAMLWWLGVGAASLGLACLPLLFGLAPDLAIAQAQTAVCSNTPDAEERIECTEDATSTSNIEIEAVDIDIDTSVDTEPGIHAKHEGTGNVEVDVRSDTSSTIDSAGSDSHGIHGEHAGTGDIIMNVKGTEITTTGDSSHGVYAEHTGDGNIDIDVTDGSDIDIQGQGDEFAIRATLVGDGDIDVLVDDTTTNGSIDIKHRGVGTSTVRVTNSAIDSDHKYGIYNEHSHTNLDPTKIGRTDTNTYVVNTNITLSGTAGVAVWGEVSSKSTLGDVLVDVDGAVIKTTGVSAIGIKGRNLADVGDVDVNVRDSTVESVSFGIEATRSSGGRGAVRLDVRDTEVTTTANYGFGIKVNNASEDTTADDVHTVSVEDSTITTKGFRAHGILSNRESVGVAIVEIQNVDIVTEGTALSSDGFSTFAVGIFARHNDTSLASNPLAEGGDLKVDVQGGSITTHGAYSYGIWGRLEEGNGGEISITTGGGNSITTTGDGGHGIVAYHQCHSRPGFTATHPAALAGCIPFTKQPT